jgi:hypothetical protein
MMVFSCGLLESPVLFFVLSIEVEIATVKKYGGALFAFSTSDGHSRYCTGDKRKRSTQKQQQQQHKSSKN